MELDDQLAALAAGELDDGTARALEARAAADPALGRRLARFRRLHGALEVPLDAPRMRPEAVGRLDARLTTALDELPDGPLVAPVVPLPAERPAATPPPEQETGGVGTVTTLRPRWSTASWGGPALGAVAAGLLAIAVLPPLFDGAEDSADEVAVDAAADSAERVEESMDAEMAEDGMAEDETSADMADDMDGMAGDAGEESISEVMPDATEEEADDGGRGPFDLRTEVQVLPPFALDPGTELQLVDDVVRFFSAIGTREDQLAVLAGLDGPAASCAAQALEVAEEGAVLVAIGEGTWDGVPAVAAVLDGVGEDGTTVVLVTTPDCVELARVGP